MPHTAPSHLEMLIHAKQPTTSDEFLDSLGKVEILKSSRANFANLKMRLSTILVALLILVIHTGTEEVQSFSNSDFETSSGISGNCEWIGNAPFCGHPTCQSGWTQLDRNKHGDGSRCLTGKKIKCCQVAPPTPTPTLPSSRNGGGAGGTSDFGFRTPTQTPPTSRPFVSPPAPAAPTPRVHVIPIQPPDPEPTRPPSPYLPYTRAPYPATLRPSAAPVTVPTLSPFGGGSSSRYWDNWPTPPPTPTKSVVTPVVPTPSLARPTPASPSRSSINNNNRREEDILRLLESIDDLK